VDDPKHILIIDDDVNNVVLMKGILDSEGYSVDYALDAHEGLNKVVPGKYIAVITDYLMPYLRGDEFLERIKRVDDKVGLILLTGYKHDIPVSTLERFDYSLEKPVDPKKLYPFLKELEDKFSES
jgi:DNA-binding NtrC family response regulator